MSVRFRNVDVDPTTDPDGWPFEAVLAVIDRGTISNWRRLAATIRRYPWGPLARAVETIVSWEEYYGVDALFADVIAGARSAADAEARRAYGAWIRSVRERSGMTLREFAPLVGTSAPRLSSYESGRVAASAGFLGRVDRVARRHGIEQLVAHP
jgi:hypothetical protein